MRSKTAEQRLAEMEPRVLAMDIALRALILKVFDSDAERIARRDAACAGLEGLYSEANVSEEAHAILQRALGEIEDLFAPATAAPRPEPRP